ncbi:MAG: hypothetical protein HCA25_14295 [Dolichospermum sp. DET50]|nr:hypothetical protein [Dolichospermum sp. DET66]MBS3033408.1 hypothetical protein [Dolichospermum sp. DET67]MBS3038612.1 hypothetical protein [Dolichospermum sp. DET50]QSX65894.1 MAG: hypothetical protein EZY12_13545 [Dolichospermum sp. DET69]
MKFTSGRLRIPSGLITAWKQDKDNIFDVNDKESECGTKVTVIVKNPDTIQQYLSDEAKRFGTEINQNSIISTKPTDDKDWVKNYLPIVGILAVAKEALTQQQIADFSTIQIGYISSIIITIKQFLKETEGDTAFSYRFYHNSLKEYLLDNKRNRAYLLIEKDYHDKIASYYKEISNSWKNINLIDHYGLLHLPQHLAAAGREEELYTLLTASPDWMNRKRDVYKSDRPYVNDLELAIAKFKDTVPPEQLLTIIKLNAALQVVYQRGSSYDDRALETLAWLGRKDEALSYVRLRTDPEQKLNALLIIYHGLQGTDQSDSTILDEATKLAEDEIEDDSWSITKILRDLVIALIRTGRLVKAEEILNKIRNESFEKIEVLVKLATGLGEIEKLNEAENIIEKINNADSKFKAFLYLATTLANTKEAKKAEHLFSLAKKLIETADWSNVFPELSLTLIKSERLLDLATALARAGYKKEANLILNKVQEIADKIEDKNNEERLVILGNLAISQAQLGDKSASEALLVELKTLADGIKENNKKKAELLQYLATVLAKAGNIQQSREVFEEAMNISNVIEDAWDRTARLRTFTENLVEAGFIEEAFAYFLKAKEAIQHIPNTNKFAKAEELRRLAIAIVKSKYLEEARKAFNEAEELAPNIEQGEYTEEVLSQWSVILAEAGFREKAQALCHNIQNSAAAKQEMDKFRKRAERMIELTERYDHDKTLREERDIFLQEIDQAVNSEVKKIAETAIKSKYFICQDLLGLVINIAQGREFRIARKVAYAIEEDWKQIGVLRELADIVAWLGYFKEAFIISGLKNGLIQFLDDLSHWICSYKTVEQTLSLEILQETTRIFGWTYPYWAGISKQLISNSNEAEFPNRKKTLTSFNSQEKEELDPPKLYIINIFPTIPLEQIQRFESCIEEAVDILYQNIESKSLENFEEAVLKQIIQSLSTKISSNNSIRY